MLRFVKDMKILIANSNPIHQQTCFDIARMYKSTSIVNSKKDLNFNSIELAHPDYIFFLHWPHMIPAEIYNNFNCVVFHMTDLPYGRGGSPLQNLILEGHQHTKISALKVQAGIDTGPLFLKRNLSLAGTAEEIFLRAGKIMVEMIIEIINTQPIPKDQEGEVTLFKRRTPEESSIQFLSDIEKVYDFIRMLDAEGYPKAFIETESFIFEFSRASIKSDGIFADVKIKKK